jgi:glycosyltransferase involved in cell wall biosynthesis
MALGVGDRVEFLGPQPLDVVRSELRQARLFVQHSVVAANGDSEGSPVSIAEAAATALPVVATRHAGIPELVLDGLTGLLVSERDAEAMGEAMARLLADGTLAGEMGRAARQHAVAEFDMPMRVGRLREIVLGRMTAAVANPADRPADRARSAP